MKVKNIITIIVAAAVLSVGSLQATGGSTIKPPVKKPHPAKPIKKPKPPVKPKKVVLRPNVYSARAIAVDLSNVVDGVVLRLADTRSLRSCGGSLDLTIGATNVGLISIGGAHVTSSGIAGVASSTAEVQNFSAILIEGGITNVIAFTSAAAQARAESTSNGVVLTASSQVQGLTINGANVAVTGEANQVITIAGGNIVLNAQVSSMATNGQRGEISVAAIFVMTAGFNGAIGFAEAGIRSGSRIPPSVRACDKVTGGGFILTLGSTNEMTTNVTAGAHGSFAVGGGTRRGQFWGHLNYIDHGTGMHVKSTSVIGFTVIDAVTRQIDYNVTIDGAPGTASVLCADNGEPGRNDLFDITLSTGYHAGGDLGGPGSGGGNIKLHKCPPGWAK